MELIDKSAIVAEIEKRRRDWRYGSSIEAKYKREECDDILSFLDTLEVKEVKVAVWSEKDEEMLDFCCDYLDTPQATWLQTLKQRIGV